MRCLLSPSRISPSGSRAVRPLQVFRSLTWRFLRCQSVRSVSSPSEGSLRKRYSMPLVSVVIPVYNGERFLWESLQSVFAQSFQDYEIICVDDGSKDASLAILNEYRDRIKVLQQANTGQAGARNAGAKTGIGKYLAFLDHDDRWYPQKLERQVAVLEANSEAIMVHCDMDWIDGTGHVTQRSVVSASRRSVHKGVTMPQLVGWDPC